MSIYENPQEYAEKYNMTLEQAEIRSKHFLEQRKLMEESRKCPLCGEYSLVLEYSDAEYSSQSWVECRNIEDGCEFTDDTGSYYFTSEHDFDVVMAMFISIESKSQQEILDYIGSSWDDFVRKDTESFMGGENL